MFDEADTIRDVLITLEKELFTLIVPILSEDQQQRWPRVTMSRERVWFAAPETALPGAPIDLLDLLENCDALSELRKSAGSTLDEYERQLVTLLRARHSADSVARRHLLKEDEELAGGRAPDETFLEERRTRTRPRLTLDNRLLDHNRRYFDQIAQRLDDESRRTFTKAYRRAALPKYFPDELADRASIVFTATLNHPQLSDDQKLRVEGLLQAYEKEYGKIFEALFEEEVRFMQEFLSTFTMHVGDQEAHINMINDSLSRRSALSQEIFSEVPSILTDEQKEWFREGQREGVSPR